MIKILDLLLIKPLEYLTIKILVFISKNLNKIYSPNHSKA